MLSANEIVQLQDLLTQSWHAVEIQPFHFHVAGPNRAWLKRVAIQHRANFDLWHIEDEARRPGVSDKQLAEVKRRIDQTNQLRNDQAERLDQYLLKWLEPKDLPRHSAPLHSESPGLMIDRLSILTLKIYHTREEATRSDATSEHVERNRQRLSILLEQRGDLTACLDALWQETLEGTRRFKMYRQLKMYNDPSLNPAIYRQQNAVEGV